MKFFLLSILLISPLSLATDLRKLACEHTHNGVTEGPYQTEEGKLVATHYSLHDIRLKIAAAVGLKRQARVPIVFEEDFAGFEIKVEAVVGCTCSVVPTKDCKDSLDDLASRYTISIVDKATKALLVSASEVTYGTDNVPTKFPALSFNSKTGLYTIFCKDFVWPRPSR